MSAPLISAQDLAYQIGDKQLLRNVSLQLQSGCITTLIGPNGAGKTTLVKLLLNLLPIQIGKIIAQKKLRIGYVPQKVEINRLMPLQVKRFLTQNPNQTDINAALAKVNATHLTEANMLSLSGGELQRVLLARALLNKPQLLILDEPAQGLDVSGQTELYKLLVNIRDDLQCGMLLISHDLHLVMAASDQVICLNKHVCCSGHPSVISNDPAYLALFENPEQAASIGLYTHHHDHSHDIHGSIIKKA